MSTDGASIVIIDDEPPIQKLIRVTLRAHGFMVSEASTGQDGIVKVSTFRPDLVILDLGLPDLDGVDVLSRIRSWSQVPIIILTARDQEGEKIKALDAGADDYVTKPFSMGELMARIRALLRRLPMGSSEDAILRCGQIQIDLSQHTVMRGSERIKVTPTEYELLKILAQNSGRVLTHKYLLQHVWGGQQWQTESQYLRIYIGHLRKKIEDDPARPKYIITEPGVGYRMIFPD